MVYGVMAHFTTGYTGESVHDLEGMGSVIESAI
jgi:hypothetical protein